MAAAVRPTTPVLCLVDSTFQHLLLNEETSMYQSYGVRTLLSGYAVICPGATLTARYTSQGESHPSILEALTIAAAQSINIGDHVRIPNVPMMSEGDNKAASEGLGQFLRKHQHKRVNVGLIPIEQSLLPVKQANYDWIGKFRTDFKLRKHELPIHIMDLQNKDLLLYNTRSVHFRPEVASEAICQLEAAALQAMDATDALHPGARPSMHVLLRCSWNTVRKEVHKEMLATRALTQADTLGALLAEAAHHSKVPASTVYALGGSYLTARPPLRIFQTYVHDSHPGPHEMMEECFPNIQRAFYDDASQVETMKELAGMVGHCLHQALTYTAHRADVWRYAEHWLRGGMYIDIKTRFVVPYRTLLTCIMQEWRPSLARQAKQLYGWKNTATGPPDYFLTAIGAKQDHIFQGIMMGRQRHPLMTAALHHCLSDDFVRRDKSPAYMTFCIVLFKAIKEDLGLSDKDQLQPGWQLCPRLGPIYLLQERHSAEVRKTYGHHNDGHFFTTQSGTKVALTRCWKWRHGWQNDPGTQRAQASGILRNLPTALQEGQQTRAQGTAPKSETALTTPPTTEANAVPLGHRHPASTREHESPASDDPPTVSTITAHVSTALESNLLTRIMQQIEAFPQYYGSLELRDVQALIPRGLSLHAETLYLQCAFCKNKQGNSTTFANDVGIKQHFARQGWHANSAIQFSEAQDKKMAAEFASSSSSGQAHQAHSSIEPYDSTGVPPPPPVKPLSVREQCSDQGFQDWVKTVGEVQAITAPQVMGLLSAGEWSKVWQRRLDILREPPPLLQCIHEVPTATGLRWQVLMTAKATIGASGDITISTYRDGQWVDLDLPTKWIGGLSALIKAAVQARFQIRTEQDAEDFMLFAATFSTIYDLTAKRVNGTSKVSYMIKAGEPPEAHIRIQHHEWYVTRTQHPAQSRGVRRPREDTEEEGWRQGDKRTGWSWSWYDQR